MTIHHPPLSNAYTLTAEVEAYAQVAPHVVEGPVESDMPDIDVARLVAAARAAVLNCTPFISAWEFEHGVDAEDIHSELCEALGISHLEWRHLALGYPLDEPDGD